MKAVVRKLETVLLLRTFMKEPKHSRVSYLRSKKTLRIRPRNHKVKIKQTQLQIEKKIVALSDWEEIQI